MRKKIAFLSGNTLLKVMLLFFSFSFTTPLWASIQIDSVKTTISTCPNNGSITVFAQTNAPAILYSIIAGPVTQPVQTNSIFSSLPPGNYTIKVINAASEEVTQTVEVSGNYIQLDFAPVAKSPYCTGGNDGRIIGNINPGTGNGPYSWQLISPSPITTGPQASDTFENLVSGNYTVRLTDACGSFRTIVATVPDIGATNLAMIEAACRIGMIGCDSALLTLSMTCNAYRLPLTCTFASNGGTFTTTTPTKVDTTFGNGYFIIEQVLTGFNYGDFVSVTITDNCGSTVNSPFWNAQPYFFCTASTLDFIGCDYVTQVTFDLNNPNCWNFNDLTTYAKAPLRYSVTDAATGLEVAADTLEGYSFSNGYNCISGFQLGVLEGNKNYNITITDSCGRTFTNSFFVPLVTPLQPIVASKTITPDACNDSVALVSIMLNHFKPNPIIIFTDGPATMGSTKPGYEYSNTHVYPDTITDHGHFVGGDADIFFVNGLSVGKYYFKVIDSCGSEVFDSLEVFPSDVSDFRHHIWYKKGCLGQNEIHVDFNNPSGYLTITNLSNSIFIPKWWSSQDWAHPISDSVLNLPSDTYIVTFTYSGYISSTVTPNSSLIYSPLSCQVITDTIVIEGYQTPVITGANSILCHNAITVELLPDSNKGVAPYQYEIIAGPQTFPVQNSNIFTVNRAGTYTARIYDICGNGSTTSITADTLVFPPIQPIQTSCNSINLTYGTSSPYYKYSWTGPGGQLYTSDTLSIDPITAADTGTYNISRMVDINGCKDTFYTSYHLTFPITYPFFQTICNGNSVTVGTHTYNSTGLYYDTLLSSKGCDSIVQLNLRVVPAIQDSLVRNICTGQSITVGTHTYNSTGIYRDTLTTPTCDSIVILNLRVDTIKKDSLIRSICTGQSINIGTHTYNTTGIYRDTFTTSTCDSIVILNLTVNAVKKDSIIRNICTGQSITVGIHTYNSTGIYRDTITTSTCDSIVILNLTVDPVKKDSIVRNICTGQSVTIGIHTYNSTGIYRDTFNTSTCDSIVILNLTVDAVKKDSIIRTICAGQNITVGLHTYNSTGIYRDTLNTSTCDSIVILNLRVDPVKKDSIVQSICPGESVTIGTHTYNSTGIYRDTLNTSTCDSIVILNLTVNTLKKDSIVRSICPGQSINVGIHTYNSTGIYRDTLNTSTCDSIVILNLTVDAVKRDSLVKDICAGQSLTIGTHNYNSTGIYRDTLNTSTCDSIVVLNLTVHPNPTVGITATPQSVTSGGTVQLNATTSPNYLWTSTATLDNNTIQNPVAVVSSSTWIYLQVISNPGNCITEDSVFIRVIPDTTPPCAGSNTYIYVPNAFTPDGNTWNDVFKIHSNNVRLNRFQVYNRWGEMVFETGDITKGWDGVYKGKIIPGNYVYWISYYECDRTYQKIMKGSIMLIR